MDTAKTGEPHFYGPVVFLNLPSDSKHLQIIDGQQRITTVVMAISLLRDEASKLQEPRLFLGTPQEQNVLQIIRNFLYMPMLYVDPRFEASYLIRDIFRTHILADPSDKRPELTVGGKGLAPADVKATRELRRSYLQIRDEFQKQLKELKHEDDKKTFMLDVFTALTSRFEIHSMELSDESEAYVLFETLNDRGLRLNPSDLLKTLTLRDVRAKGDNNALNAALNNWDEMVLNLGDYDFSKFLRHFLLTESKGPVQANKIYGLFKNRIESKRGNGAYQNLQDLFEASKVYSRLLDETQHPDPEIRATIVRLNSFSDTHRVLLMAIPENDLVVDTVRKLYRAVELLSFRWVVAGWNAQVLENNYQKFAQALAKNPSEENAEKVLEEILSKAPSDQDLDGMTSSDSIQLQKYLLRRIEETSGGHVLSWDDPITLEHLAPQNPGLNGDYWYHHVASAELPDANGRFYDDYVRRWGNLTLLEKKLNSSIRNAPWQKKLTGEASSQYDGLNASTMNLNKAIITAPDWTIGTITDRNTWIHNSALELVGQNWVKTGKARLVKWVP